MHISVERPIVAPVADFLTPLNNAKLQSGGADMFETLVVAADLIHEKTADKRFNRRIVYITNADCIVRRKEDLSSIVDALKVRNVSLVVIGIDFEEPVEDEDDDWSKLTNKQQNERVLRFMCEQLPGDNSMVVPVSDAATALSALRKKNIPQRTHTRCVLSIGDVKIPVYFYVKSLSQAFPSMHRTTEKGDFVTERRYFSVRQADTEIDPSDRVKAFRYGKSVIPFNEVDEAQMKFQAHRSMEALGFVPIASIPLHVLMGGVKAVAPPPGDSNAALALASFVHGMEHLQRAMLVRFVWRENSEPVLGACFPSAKAARDIMYFAPLPFAEDFRHYSFRSFDEVSVTAREAKCVDDLVRSMTVDDATLSPKSVFNPALQQYYTSLRTRYLDPDASIPPLPPELKRSACAWGEPGNVLEPVLAGAQDGIKELASLFPSAPPKADATKAARVFWFTKGKQSETKVEDDGDAPPQKKPRKDNYFGSHSTETTQASPTTLKDAVAPTATKPLVTTIDPVGSFKAAIGAKGTDNVARAIFEMSEVILKLLRDSIGEQYYKRVDECVDALRAACIDEAEPSSFNKFLLNLMLTFRGESHDAYWTKHVIARGVHPITRSECEESDVPDEEAAAFLREDRALARPVIDEEAEEDLFDQLE